MQMALMLNYRRRDRTLVGTSQMRLKPIAETTVSACPVATKEEGKEGRREGGKEYRKEWRDPILDAPYP